MADQVVQSGEVETPMTAADALKLVFPEWMVEEGVTLREAIFADIYARTFDSLSAYRDSQIERATGDDVKDAKAASKMLYRRKLNTVISRLVQERTGLSTVWLVDRLAAIAATDLPDIFEWNDLGHLTIKDSAKLTPAQRAAILSLKRDPETGEIEIKLHNKIDALDKLIRVQGLFRDKIEVAGKDGGAIKIILSQDDQAL